jgi:hypothetical protein
MRQIQPSLWSGVLPRPLLYIPPSHVPHFRKCRNRRSQSRGCPLWSVPLIPLPVASLTISPGLYVSLFAACVSVLYNKQRRRGGGNYRLILVSTTLFILITWVRPSLRRSLSFHSFPPQHLVLDVVRLYIAFHGSETDQGADSYFLRVTSTTSIIKTSVYLAETIVSDLFIVRLYPPSPFSRCALYRPSCAPSSIGAILYGTRASPSSFSQSFYISPTSVCLPIVPNPEVH